ncbi:MAG: response regulator [Bacteroidales bacterium]
MSDSKFTLLVVDDDQQSILILKQIFKKLPYQIITSENGLEALELAKIHAPDLILLDILMPDISGLEVCRSLKLEYQTRNIPVIFITALDQQEELVKGFQAGAVDYITKPYQKEELQARVQNHLQLKHSKDVIAHQNQNLQLEVEQRKQTEEKFRALSQAGFEAVFFVKDNLVVESNDAASQLFGFPPQELTSRQITTLVTTGEKKKLQEALSTGGDIPIELLFRRKDKSTFSGQLKQQEYIYRNEKIRVIAVSDVSRIRQLEQQVRNAIIETEERERKRFAMDLHDGLGALLSTLKIYVNLIQKPDKSQEDKDFLLHELKTNINEAVATARRIANNLMPSTLNDYGLLPALESFCQKIVRAGTININISCQQNFPRLEKNMEINLYRVFTELINNTLKHAQAQAINLDLRTENGSLIIKYQDDGLGFDPEKVKEANSGSHGLKNIRTRVQLLQGDMKILAPASGGISFNFEIPI